MALDLLDTEIDPAWSTAVPDWKERIRERRGLIPDLPLFDAVADKALRIFKRLRVPDIIGNPTYGAACDEWVFGFVRAIFGSYDPETKRRMIREFFLLVPKKNGKSSIAAAIIVTAAIMNERPEAELLLIAPTKAIADIAFKQAKGIIRLDEELTKLFQVQEHLKKITHRNSLAEILIKAADAETITGSKATFILIDETHVFSTMSKASDVFVEIRGGLAARPDGFLLQITTQSKKPPSGVFKNELDIARAVRDGQMSLPLLAVLYELPVEMSQNGGWKVEETWGMVNPNLGKSLDRRYLVDELLKAERKGAEEMALFASQHFNVQIGLGLNADGWSGALHWEGAACEGLTLDEVMARSEVLTVGIDWGGADDLAALAVIGRDKVTREWLLWVRAWARQSVFDARPKIAQQLRDFEADGDLRVVATGDEQANEAAEICKQLFDAGLLPEQHGIGLDAAGVALLVDALEARDLTSPLVEAVGQGWKLQSAISTLPLKLEGKKLLHGNQPIMGWAVTNAKQELRGSNYIVTKQASGAAKIDPLMAVFNAAMLMFLNPMPSGENMDGFLSNPVMVV